MTYILPKSHFALRPATARRRGGSLLLVLVLVEADLFVLFLVYIIEKIGSHEITYPYMTYHVSKPPINML